LVTLSARSAGSLRRLRAAYADFVADTEHGLAEIARLLNRGRDDHPHRLAWAVAGRDELLDALRAEAPDPAPVTDAPRVVLLCSGDGEVDDERWRAWAGGHPPLAAVAPEVAAGPPAARLVARQYALARLLDRLGVGDVRLVGSGPGNLVVRALRGELTLAEALAAAADWTVTDAVDENRLVQAANAFLREPSVLVELAPEGVLSRAFARAVPGLRAVSLTSHPEPSGAAELLARLYRLGVRIDWERHHEGQPPARIEGPTYPFEATRCWCRPVGDVARRPAAEPPARTPEPAGDQASAGDQSSAGPGWSATERALAGIWRDVLKESSVEPAANYFQLGGTSIAAQVVIARARRELGVAMTFRDLFANPTLRALAARVDELRAAGPEAAAAAEEIPRAPRDRPLPLTYGQEQLWFLDRLNPGSPLYNIPTDLHLRGPLDVDALRAALRTLAERHEILRTSIRERDGEPGMVVDCDPPGLPVTDLSWLPAPERDREVRRLIHREAGLPFALERGPLLRAALLRLGPAEHVLLVTYHHIVFDGWTPAVIHRELAEAYRGHRAGRAPDLPPLPIQYGDFAAWQRSALRGERLERGLRFWRGYLEGYAPFEPPLDRPRPPRQSYRGEMLEFNLDPEVGEAVRALAAAAGVSTFVAMFALVGALVADWAGVEDVAIGVATSGRYHPATTGLIGYFNNVVPFRLLVRPELTARQLVVHSARRVAEVLDHEEVPFERIVEDWRGRRSADRHPIYTVAYTHQNAPNSPLDLGDVAVSRYLDAVISGVPPGTAKFDLTLAVVDQNRGPMTCAIEYAADLFERASVEALVERWRALLRRATGDPDRPVCPEAALS
ncbi:MAG TPA: condensation domain-containing protein, partial [Candidatus Dormibacteraeota bacterium]|nr:condensation domain-containing protein [Candidatus Dormibacteraeota bacterium]